MHEQLAGYISGPVNAEDLAVAPGGEWVLTSGMTGPTAPLGRLYAVSVATGACNEIYPYRASAALDTERFVQQPDLNPLKFRPHGIDVVLRPDGRAELYVVNHGGNESVEVFDVDLDESRPSLKWIGGVRVPGPPSATMSPRSTTASSSVRLATPKAAPRSASRRRWQEPTPGGVLEWSPPTAGSRCPARRSTRPTASRYRPTVIGCTSVAGIRAAWEGSTWQRPTPTPPPCRVDIMVDNLTWSASGRLLAAGTYGTSMQDFLVGHSSRNPRMGIPSRVISIDAETLETERLIDYGPDTFGAATTALQVGREIWVGTARDQGLARFRFPTPNRR